MTPASCTTFFSVLCKFFKDLFLDCLGSSRKRMQRYELFLNWQIFLQEIFNKKQKKYLRLICVKGKTGIHLIILYSMPGLPDLNYIENLGGDSIWLESNPLLTRAKSRFDSRPPFYEVTLLHKLIITYFLKYLEISKKITIFVAFMAKLGVFEQEWRARTHIYGKTFTRLFVFSYIESSRTSNQVQTLTFFHIYGHQ